MLRDIVPVLVFVACVGASLYFLGIEGTSWLVVGIAVVGFIVRRPLVVLIALLFGMG